MSTIFVHQRTGSATARRDVESAIHVSCWKKLPMQVCNNIGMSEKGMHLTFWFQKGMFMVNQDPIWDKPICCPTQALSWSCFSHWSNGNAHRIVTGHAHNHGPKRLVRELYKQLTEGLEATKTLHASCICVNENGQAILRPLRATRHGLVVSLTKGTAVDTVATMVQTKEAWIIFLTQIKMLKSSGWVFRDNQILHGSYHSNISKQQS